MSGAAFATMTAALATRRRHCRRHRYRCYRRHCRRHCRRRLFLAQGWFLRAKSQ